jgi:hypothetical protein
MKKLQSKVVEKINTNVMFNNCFSFSQKPCSRYEIMWKNMVQPDGQATHDNIIRRMRFARLITEATDTHSEYVICIAFPLQQWLHERASVLRHRYIACFVHYCHCYNPRLIPFRISIIYYVRSVLMSVVISSLYHFRSAIFTFVRRILK